MDNSFIFITIVIASIFLGFSLFSAVRIRDINREIQMMNEYQFEKAKEMCFSGKVRRITYDGAVLSMQCDVESQ